jgi:glucosamine--fructose-6-phosphate aminotransferase (isomerizing)
MQIADLPREVEVLALDQKSLRFVSKKARVFRHAAPKELLEIRTATSTIRCTKNHRMFVVEKGEFVEKLAKEILPGDIVCFAKKISAPGRKLRFVAHEPKRYWELAPESIEVFRGALKSLQLTPALLSRHTGITLAFIRHILDRNRNAQESSMRILTAALSLEFPLPGMKPIHSHHGNFVHLPDASSPELMQIIGYFLGDGHAHERCIRWKDTRTDVLLRYRLLSERVFNLEGRVVQIAGSRAWLLEVNSTDLVLWLRRNILDRRKNFYDELGLLSDSELAAFLKGIFDAEGIAAESAGQIALTMNDGDLMRRIQQWLLRFEIIGSISIQPPNLKNRKPNISYRLSISGADSVRRFQEQIGFSASDKHKSLQMILNKKEKNRVTVSYHSLPWHKEQLLPLLKKSGIRGKPYRCLHGKGFASIGVLEKFLGQLNPAQRSMPIIRKIETLLGGDVVFQKIRSVELVNNGSAYVYDLEVPGAENFIANGLLSHNSRWATHGSPTDVNAHPHPDCRNEFFVVHNGIIENHGELREKLEKLGHNFRSETDTEVIAHLLERQTKNDKQKNLEQKVLDILPLLRGTYALAIVSKHEPNKVVAARNFSPLILGIARNEYFAASDASAILAYTKKVVYLADGEVAVLSPQGVKILNAKSRRAATGRKKINQLDWNFQEAQKGGWPHFTIKEIMEIPAAMENAMRGRVIPFKGAVKFGGLEAVKKRLKKIEKLNIVACGSAYCAAKAGEYWLENIAGIDAEADIASEFRYRNPALDPKQHAVLAISQSGETADTLAAVELAKQRGLLTLGIVNVVGSSVARSTDAGVYQYAGPEIGVATTKAFVSQLVLLVMFAIWMGLLRKTYSPARAKTFLKELAILPRKVSTILESAEAIRKVTEKFSKYNNFFVLARNYNAPIAYEGAIKIKEITYSHAEGYAAGEMKHGPLAMVDENFATIAIAPQDSVYEKMLSNLQEIKARGGPVLAIAAAGDEKIKTISDDVIYIPKTLEPLYPILTVIPLQLLAYYIGVARKLDVDKPRNLAKSVTVE